MLPLTCPFLSVGNSSDPCTRPVTVVLLVADGRFPPPLTQPKVAVTVVSAVYVTSVLPRPTSVQLNDRSGSCPDGLALDATVRVAAPELPATRLTETVLKCGKFA